MAEKDDTRPPGRAEAVRGAAVQAFQATAGQAGMTRERAQDLADELAQAAGRFMGALDELRPATGEEIRSLRDDIRALERRIVALETAAAAAAKPKKNPAARKPAAKKRPTS
jgi:polyhydroxyalkanoate synthesis regulator phasin